MLNLLCSSKICNYTSKRAPFCHDHDRYFLSNDYNMGKLFPHTASYPILSQAVIIAIK